MQQTLLLRVSHGYVRNIAPWAFVPEDDRSKVTLVDADAVQFLNESGWTTLNVVPVDGGYFDKEIWLVREVEGGS